MEPLGDLGEPEISLGGLLVHGFVVSRRLSLVSGTEVDDNFFRLLDRLQGFIHPPGQSRPSSINSTFPAADTAWPPFPLDTLLLSRNEVVQVLPVPLSHLVRTHTVDISTRSAATADTHRRRQQRLTPETTNLGVKVFRGAHPYWVIRNLEGLLPDGIRYSDEEKVAEGGAVEGSSSSSSTSSTSAEHSQASKPVRKRVIGLNGELVDVASVTPPPQPPATVAAEPPPTLEVWGLTGWLVNVFMKRAGWWVDFPEVKEKKGKEGTVKAML